MGQGGLWLMGCNQMVELRLEGKEYGIALYYYFNHKEQLEWVWGAFMVGIQLPGNGSVTSHWAKEYVCTVDPCFYRKKSTQ